MRILAVSQWWPPEPAQLVASLVGELAAKGHDMQVLTGFPNYPSGRLHPDYPLKFRRVDFGDGIRVVRSPLFPSHDSSAVGRALNYLSFGLSSSTIGLAGVGRPDVAYVYHPPITSASPARLLRRLRGVPYVLHVQDLWPDAVLDSGMVGAGRSRRVAGHLLGRMADRVYRYAAHIVVITPGFKHCLIERGVPADKISVILNWSPGVHPPPPDPARRAELGPTDRRIMLFAGNVGRFQNLELVVHQMAALERSESLHLAILGSGIERDHLQRLVADLRIDNVSFLERCDPDRAVEYQQLADVHLVSLADNGFLSATIPSKTPTAMALGKPVVMVAGGDAADLVTTARAGLTASPDPGSVKDVLATVASLSDDELAELGDAGRDYHDDHLSIEVASERFEDILRSAARR